MAAVAIASLSQSGVLAQNDHGHSATAERRPETPEGVARRTLVRAVREATRRFLDPAVAMSEGYLPQFGCVTGSSEGVMGVHFVNGGLVNDGQLHVEQPELLVYEPAAEQPVSTGRGRLPGARREAWHATNPAPPQLMGQLFHLFESPNRFGLPEFFTLHVWAWKDNPNGTFANWNPNVSCDA